MCWVSWRGRGIMVGRVRLIKRMIFWVVSDLFIIKRKCVEWVSFNWWWKKVVYCTVMKWNIWCKIV